LYLAKGRCIDIDAYDDPFALPSGMGLGPDIRPSAGTRVCFALVSFCYMFFLFLVTYAINWADHNRLFSLRWTLACLTCRHGNRCSFSDYHQCWN